MPFVCLLVGCCCCCRCSDRHATRRKMSKECVWGSGEGRKAWGKRKREGKGRRIVNFLDQIGSSLAHGPRPPAASLKRIFSWQSYTSGCFKGENNWAQPFPSFLLEHACSLDSVSLSCYISRHGTAHLTDGARRPCIYVHVQ